MIAPRAKAGTLTLGILSHGAMAPGCGGSTTAIVVPSTTTVADQAPATVPALGSPSVPLPPTAANALANAQGACSTYDRLYIQLDNGASINAASSVLATSLQFATNAANGARASWAQLLHDTQALADFVTSPSWNPAASEIAAAPVTRLYEDCRSLQ